VFEKDCLVYLGTCIAPVGGKPGKRVLDLEWRLAGGDFKRESLAHGDFKLVELRDGAHAEAVLKPARGVDVGGGPGVPVHRKLRGGVVGLVLDARGRRPFAPPVERTAQVQAARTWSDALAVYPETS